MQSQETHNLKQLVYDIAWFGLAWVTVTRFLSVYAIRVGATPIELSWLTSGPPLMMTLGSVIGVWWRNRHPDSVRAIFWPGLGFRLSFFLLALTPLLPPLWQPSWLIFSVMLPAIPQGISNVIFLALMKEATPAHRMTTLLSRRTLAVNITLGLGALGFGLWLEQVAFPLNYSLMFVAAFGAAIISLMHVNQVQPLKEVAAAPPPMPQHPLRDTTFRGVLLVSTLAYVAFFSVFPVIALRLVRDLGASEGFMGAYGTVELVAGTVFAIFIARIVGHIGNRRMIGMGIAGTAVAAVVIALTPSLWVTLLAAAITGAAWTAAEIGTVGHMAESSPTVGAAYYTRMFSQSIWIAMFIGPFLGTWLVEIGVGLSTVLLLGAGLRLLAGGMILRLASQSRRRHTRYALGD